MHFNPTVWSTPAAATGYWFCFREDKLLVHQEGEGVRVPCTENPVSLGIEDGKRQLIGELDGRPCYAVSLPSEARVPNGMLLSGLRDLFSLIDDQLFWIAGRASQLLRWERTHRFCGGCGSPTRMADRERALVCGACGLKSFPAMSPAVIVAVRRNDRILLARAHRFPPHMYSVIAGFVEPGETLEQCVGREVREETGIEVKNIRYFGSQPWPFPNSLMVAFTAEYAGGNIRLGDDEIADAGWFGPPEMPPIPPRISVARRLIDWFLGTTS